MKKIFLLLFIFTLSACATRVPNTHTSEKIIQKYFKKYAKKYPESIIGKSPVQSVEMGRIEESQKHVAIGQATLNLQDGQQIPILMNFLYKAPLGWRALSWENLKAGNSASKNPPSPNTSATSK